ncbi:MAG: ASKHA domain-containing protein [Megasphaera sp.]|nr:ASKHA domain-containing protein [Megasphaera sp.]MCH4218421.1 ASKHA domain-containing protein [Megasphaera sp.]
MNDIRIIQGRYTAPDVAMALQLAGYAQGASRDRAMAVCQRLVPVVRRSIKAKAALAFAPAGRHQQGLYVVMTLGAAVSRQGEHYFHGGNEWEGMLFDALADSCLFTFEKQLLQQIRSICLERHVGIAQRHEAGVDLPLSVQGDAARAVAASRTIGVTVSEDNVLEPMKSMCMVFDLTDDTSQFHMEHDCARCPHQDCPMRRIYSPAAGTTAQQVTCPAGQCILSYLQQQEIPLPAHCGGKGICGACRVCVHQGRVPVTADERNLFTPQELEQGWRLACRAIPQTECIITLPSEAEKNMAAVAATGQTSPKEHTVSTTHEYGLAIDIGTTTLAAALVDRTTAAILHTVTAVNSQRVYGADVVSRMAAAARGCGPGLQYAVRHDLLCAIGRLMEPYTDIRPEQVAISANTTMQHLLMGYSCDGLGAWPFHPVSLGGEVCSWREVFGEDLDDVAPSCAVTLLPGISAYVGADITSGLWHCQIHKKKGLSLFIDLGTNGEMALGNAQRMVVTSTSAGPALEGGHLSCGIGSVPGAVCSISLRQDGSVCTTTIDHEAPLGLCGTGVIEGMAVLLEKGCVDATGKLAEPYFHDGFAFTHRADGKPVGFTQEDIRDIQMAKGAIRAGIETLLHQWGAAYEDVAQVYLAGGFGYYLNPQRAAVIGLLPQELASRTIAAGNTSLAGAVDVLTDTKALAGMTAICANATETILGNTPEFQKLYIQYMSF